eukprot:TRINITY_DN14457_c2_g1_i2.p1 TRINITY_DN14457_c2_g1~~TRINITY_DN14457_c2_g1_i2.p1  ORF type:complete len:1059 (+),score=258.08 TRINITY_DN14457_c2_g1_i2:107-3178(+)
MPSPARVSPGGRLHVPYAGEDSSVAVYQQARASRKVVLVGNAGCTFCQRAKTELGDILTPDQFQIFECDHLADGDELRKTAKADAGDHPTVPMVFHGTEFLGGCDTVMKMKESGQLFAKLGVAPAKPATTWDRSHQRRAPHPGGLFYFPHTVNNWVVRGIALQAVFCCVASFVLALMGYRAAPGWIMIGLCADFAVRFVGGGNCSPLGALAMVATSFLEEKMVSGPQKQFATAIGVCFAGAAGALLLADQRIAGGVVCMCLCGPAALEAFLDFCLGCWFFKHMINFGIFPASVNDLHIGQKPLVENQLKHADDRSTDLHELEVYVHQQAGQPHTDADLRVKARKTDDHRRRDFHPVKNVMLGDMMMPVGIAGLAVAWKIARYTPMDSSTANIVDNDAWKAIMWVAIAVFLCVFTLLVAKVFMFPRKLLSEVAHPLKSNAVASGPTAMILISFLILDSPDDAQATRTRDFALVLFWAGAVLNKLLLVWKLSWVVSNRSDGEPIAPALLFPMAGCLAAAMVAPGLESLYSSGYTEVGWFFYSLSALLSVLFVGTGFFEAVRYHWSDERVRPTIAMWVVVVMLNFLAFTVLTQGPGVASGGAFLTPVVPGSYVRMSTTGHVLFYSGLGLFLVLLWLAVPMGFLLRLKFDFSFWALAFPLDLMAAATLVYHRLTRTTAPVGAAASPPDDFSKGLAFAFLATATYANATLFLNTVYWLIKRRWLRPAYKWAPLSMNKLTHEAFRAAGQRMLLMARALQGDGGSLELAKGLASEWIEYTVVLEWHAHQENNIMFREIDAFNPFATRDGYLQHKILESREQEINASADRILAASTIQEASGPLQALVSALEAYVPFMDKHMDWEEENLLALNRRTFNMEIQIRMVRKIWEAYEFVSVEEFKAAAGHAAPRQCAQVGWEAYDMASFRDNGMYGYPDTGGDVFGFPPNLPVEELPLDKQQVWRVVLPFVIRNLPEPVMRTRFVRCLVWAVPERAQCMGDMIYRGVQDHEWSAVAADVPEIIPRGLPGWTRRV